MTRPSPPRACQGGAMAPHPDAPTRSAEAPGWAFDELGHAGPEHLDPGYVAGYDTKSGADPVDDVAALRDLGLAPDATVVDLGAGTGRFSLAVAPHCSRVVAVDVSPAML